jgi:hypothetical protein
MNQHSAAKLSVPPKKVGRGWKMVGILAATLLVCITMIASVYFMQQRGIIPSAPELDGDLPAHYGDVTLSAGFTPSPYTVSVFSGGHYNVSKLISGADCKGYANQEPSISLNISGDLGKLNILYTADTGINSLIIRDPNGKWYCSRYYVADVNPSVTLLTTTEGQYDIWVTNSVKDSIREGILYITGSDLDYSALPPTASPVKVVALDTSLAPNNPPTIYLAGLFTPDPVRYRFEAKSGGSLDISESFYYPDCAGYATPAPDYVVYWSGGGPYLSFFFVANQGIDTTLTIQDSRGTWYCNDNSSDGINPMVSTFSVPGEYKVWIGRKTVNTGISGIFYVAHGQNEFSPRDFPDRTSILDEALDHSLPPSSGTIEIGAKSELETYSLEMSAGGSLNLSSLDLGYDCAGFANTAPDFSLTYSGDAAYLVVTFTATDGADTTLAILDPAESWYCGDDYGGGSIDPVDVITYPFSGQYFIWVGNHEPGATAIGTLKILETDGYPWP